MKRSDDRKKVPVFVFKILKMILLLELSHFFSKANQKKVLDILYNSNEN